jgi:hypothetical protein
MLITNVRHINAALAQNIHRSWDGGVGDTSAGGTAEMFAGGAHHQFNA